MTLRRFAPPLLILSALLGSFASMLRAEEIEAVSSRVADDYVRTKTADGSFQSETYAFGPGGHWGGGSDDPSIEKLPFLDVARVIAAPLASQNYLPTRDSETTKLLIMVYWGTTNPPDRQGGTASFQNAASAMNALQAAKNAAAPTATNGMARARGTVSGSPEEENAATTAIAMLQAENAQRRRRDIETSKILGYDSWWAETSRLEGTPLDTRRHDLLNELEDSRYFVVLMAYDFQLMWKQKKSKLLWETRFSVSQRHHLFDEVLPVMAQHAARYFGQDSHGLQHREVPIGKVELGELKSLGESSDKPVTTSATEK